MTLLLLVSVLVQGASAPEYPRQRPLMPEAFEACRVPEYSADELRAMAAVSEVAEAADQFPGSYLFVPAAPGPHPGILTLHGSGGGRHTAGRMCLARFYAAQGFAALAFCYFDCGDARIPEALGDVDLRRTYDALVWLKRSAYVGGGRVALAGASRGAEQAALLASLLGDAARTDAGVVVPDAVYASAPFGRVVGRFNWRRDPADERWQKTRAIWADCVSDAGAPGCSDRPALDPAECWVDDPVGRHPGPDGRPRSWVASRCAAEPGRPGQIFDRPAWTWDRDPELAKPGTDIDLSRYPGPILLAHGSVDPVWSVEDGPDHLRRTLTRRGVPSHRAVVPPCEQPVRSWADLPADRVLFYIFEGEPHRFSTCGAVARRALVLAFLERHLR